MNIEYLMFDIYQNLGSDMSGVYFIQKTNNEEAIKKFIKINTNGNVIFYDTIYTLDQIMTLKLFDNKIWNLHVNDIVQRLVLSGKFEVPGKNEVYEENELIGWWIKYLDSTKFPSWFKLVENVIDLTD